MLIKKDMKMSSVIHLNYQLLPVLQRFGIELGFGDKTVDEVCSNYGIETDFFLDIANAYTDDNYFPKKHLSGFSASVIIEYLQNTHDYYLNEKVPQIDLKIKKLMETSRADNGKLKLIKDFFEEYKQELMTHIKREDEEVYPYVIELEKFYHSEDKNDVLREKMKQYSIMNFADEHDNMEEKLYDLKNILIKYLPPQDDRQLIQSIIIELFELEKDLADHSMIEDKVLIPKVVDIERKMHEKNM